MELFIVDEANFISPNCYDGLLPHAQKRGGKLIFTSSSASVPTQEKANKINLDVLRETPRLLFASLTYVCNDHLPEFVAQTKRTSCDCYVHLEPFHVDNNASDRTVADKLNEATGRDIGYLMDRGVSCKSLLARGIEHEKLPLLMTSTISNMLEHADDTYTMAKNGLLDNVLIVYVDPCPYLSPYSKNGISVCSRYRDKEGAWTYVVLGVDHCYHASSGISTVSMFQFVPDLIVKLLSNICSLHPHPQDETRSHFTEALVVIECNSYDVTETAGNLNRLLIHNRPAILHNMHVHCLNHEATGHHILSEQASFIDPRSGKRKTCNIKPGFVMDWHKCQYFENVFDMMKTGRVSLSQFLTSVYVEPRGQDSLQDMVMEHLCSIQVKDSGAGTTYRGKGKWKQDDLAVSVIMSIYISLNRGNYIWKKIGC